MTDGTSTQHPSEESLLSFFPRLERLSGLLGVLTDEQAFRASVGVRGSPRRITLDFSGSLQVREEGASLDGEAGITGSVDDLHAAFLGRLGIMKGIAERRLLLHGGMQHLVMMFPVFEQIPVPYLEHLSTQNGAARRVGPVRRGFARALGAVFGLLAYLAGRLLGRLDRRALIRPLTALASGAARFSRDAVIARPRKTGRASANPLQRPPLSRWRRLWIGFVSVQLHLAGWLLSLCKFKLGVPMDLFRPLGRLSDGIGRTASRRRR